MKDILSKWEYHLPSDTTQLKQLVEEVKQRVIEDVKKKVTGEVINGTLTEVILVKNLEKYEL